MGKKCIASGTFSFILESEGGGGGGGGCHERM